MSEAKTKLISVVHSVIRLGYSVVSIKQAGGNKRTGGRNLLHGKEVQGEGKILHEKIWTGRAKNSK